MLLDEIRLLAIKTHILATEAEFEEMKSENYERTQRGLSLAYTNFSSISNKCELILKRLEEFNNEITQF